MTGHRKCVIVFAKYPEPGKVKTRLTPSLTNTQAASLYKSMLDDTIELLNYSGIDYEVYCEPAGSIKSFRKLYGKNSVCLGQKGADIGEKMKNAFKSVFRRGYAKAVLVGSDIPGLSAELIRESFRQIDRRGAVIGPAKDGGYYLVGFAKNAFCHGMFSGVGWGKASVFKKTMEVFKKNGRRAGVLPKLRDVDSIKDVLYYFRRVKLKNSRFKKFIEALNEPPRIKPGRCT